MRANILSFEAKRREHCALSETDTAEEERVFGDGCRGLCSVISVHSCL